ncbi:MAG: VWA domain-containing protein [Marinilabiliaceae bacterium]|nr:VWA domain-containing protein [Marinilabiliaceae bacterium]
MKHTGLIIIILLLALPLSSRAQKLRQTGETTRILFVLDCSQSMAGEWGSDKKINTARKFLGRTIDSLSTFPNVEMALRVYGHQSVVPPQDCNDTRLEVAFAPDNAYRIKRKMLSLAPKGTTPIANSLAAAGGDFPPRENCRNVVILITDGIEACDGDPCAVAMELQRKGILLKPFIIGIGLDPSFEKSFECLGNVYNASSEERFGEILDIVVTHALTETTLQVNLLDAYGLPSETNVPVTFYNRNTGGIKYNFVHTLNHRGNPDTMRIDPLIEYRLKAHTIPPVVLDSLLMAPGKHNIAALDAPQGTLKVVQKKGFQYRDLKFIVREHGKMETLNRQLMFEDQKYITGSYDLEIPTLPVSRLNNINIRQSELTTVTLPQPGVVTILSGTEGICELFVERDGDLEYIYTVKTADKTDSIVLLPGYYRVIFRPIHSKQSHYTVVKRFSIESGKSSSLRVF